MDYNWQTITTTTNSVEITGATAGTYEIEVVAINGSGVRSEPSTFTQTVSSLVSTPVDVTGASITPVDDSLAIISWDKAPDLSVLIGGQLLIRHQPVVSGATWQAAAPIVPGVAGSESSATVPMLRGTYLLKFNSSNNVRSTNAVALVIDTEDPDVATQAFTIREASTSFQGTPSGLVYFSEYGGLTIDGETYFDLFAVDGNFDGLGTLESMSGTASSGEYKLASYYDLGAIYHANIKRFIQIAPMNLAYLFDDNLVEMDTWGDFDGADVTDTSVTLYVRTTNDNPASSPIWSEWRVCTNNLIKARAFEFKVIATSQQESQNIIVSDVGADIYIRQRIERSASIASGAGTYAATFTNAFYSNPAVSVSPTNMATGDYFTISSVTVTGFQVAFFNSGGTPIDRQFTYTAVGYGRRF